MVLILSNEDTLLKKFEPISQVFAKIGMQEALRRKKNVSVEEIKQMNAQLKGFGLSWKDMGIDPGDLVNISDISDKDYDEFLNTIKDGDKLGPDKKKYKGFYDWFKQKYVDPDFEEKKEEAKVDTSAPKKVDGKGILINGVKVSLDDVTELFTKTAKFRKGTDDYNNAVDSFLIRKGYIKSTIPEPELEKSKIDNQVTNDKLVNALDAIRENTEVSAHADLTEVLDNTGGSATTSQVKTMVGIRGNSRVARSGILGRISSVFGSIFRRKNEDSESEKARSLGVQTDENGNAIIDAEVIEESGKKKSVFSSIGGFISKMFGSLGSWISNSSIWSYAGVGLAIAALFGKQLTSIFSFLKDKFEEHLLPKMKTLGEKFSTWFNDTAFPFVQENLSALGAWWHDNKSSVINNVKDLLISNMNPIMDTTIEVVKAAGSVVGSALLNLGKRFVNSISETLGIGAVFKDVVSYGDTYVSYEQALKANDGKSNGIVYDEKTGTYMVLDSRTYIDENGEYQHVGSSGATDRAPHALFNYATQKGTRMIVNKTAKAAFKTAGWLTGITPAGKVLKKVGSGALTLGKGAVSLGKAIFKKSSKTATNVAASAAKEAATEAVEVVAGEVVEDVVENSTGLVVKNAAKSAATQTYQSAYANAFLTELVKRSNNEVLDKAKTEATQAVIESAAKNAGESYQTMYVKAYLKSLYENSSKTILEETAEKIAKEANIKNGTKQLAKTNKTTIINLIKKAVEKISGISGKLTKWIKDSWFGKVVKDMGDKILKWLASASDDVINRLGKVVSKKTTEATADTLASATVIVQVGFTIYDLASGFCEAAYLFEVDDKYVTAGMRTVSAAMKALFGIGIMSWIDLFFEVYSILSGHDAKKAMATALYKFFANEDAEAALDRAQLAMQIEVDKYNAANNTRLDVNAYNEMKNQGWFSKLISGKIFENTKAKYSKYAATDAEINRAMYNAATSTTDSDLLYHGTGSSDSYYGPHSMKSRVVGYGHNLTQNDARWANFPIGTFPDGTTSTMATGGCGPTALSMVASQFGSKTSPLAMAQYAKANGYISEGGANADLFTHGASKLGLNPSAENRTSIRSALQKGSPVVLAGKSSNYGSPYTQAGHVIMAEGYNPSTGNVTVSNPMSADKQIMNIDKLTSGMTHAWSYSVGYGNGNKAIGYSQLRPDEDPMYGKSAWDVLKSLGSWIKGAVDKYAEHKLKTDDLNLRVQQEQNKLIGNAAKLALAVDTTSVTVPGTSTQIDTTKANKNSNTVGLLSFTKSFFEPYITKAAKAVGAIGTTLRVLNEHNNNAANNTANIAQINKLLSEGYTQDSNGIMNWQKPEFYDGMSVGMLKALAKADPALLTSLDTTIFAMMYRYYVNDHSYSDTIKITLAKATEIAESAVMTMTLGGSGTENEYMYKNGFPFFSTADKRWSDISWRNKTVRTRGSDLASLAMIASAYGGKLIPPDYIYNNWLSKYPNWYDSNGIKESTVFSDGGYNAMQATQVNGRRVIVRKVVSPSSILSALKQKKPVYLSGYKYDGSLFGGTGDKDSVNINDKDSIGSAIALYANDSYLALNDPYTAVNDPSVFSTELLKDKVGKDNLDAIKSAYIVTDPDGSGISGPISLSSLNAPGTKYKSLKDATSVADIFATIFGNFASVGSNLLTSFITGDKYTSIFDTTLSGDGEDETGVGHISYDPSANTEAVLNPTSSGATLKKNPNLTTQYSNKTPYSIAYGIGTGVKDLDVIKGNDSISSLFEKIGAVYSADMNSKLTGKSYSDSLSDILSKYNPSTDAALIDESDPLEMADDVKQSGTSIGSSSNLNFKTTETR